MTKTVNPTTDTYNGLNAAYVHFNKWLFGNELPTCLVTLQRKSKAYGYFAGDRFGSHDGKLSHDEIALNPSHFAARTTEQSLSTLVHEMAHLWQHRFGKPSRTSYHNKQWAEKMIAIGLHPSSTGEPGGKTTGQKVTHYILDNGAYKKAFAALQAKGFAPLIVEKWDEEKAAKKATSKTKFTCPDCGQNAWGKPELSVICGDCLIPMESGGE